MGNIKHRRGTKTAILLQYPEELIKSANDITDFIRKDFESQKRKLLVKDSIRVLKWCMTHGYNGDDFVQNLYSVVFTGKGYKVSRIIKKMLLK